MSLPHEVWFVYELTCPLVSGVFYIGITNKPGKRLQEHQEGLTPTSSALALKAKDLSCPLEIRMAAACCSLAEAYRVEAEHKLKMSARGFDVLGVDANSKKVLAAKKLLRVGGVFTSGDR